MIKPIVITRKKLTTISEEVNDKHLISVIVQDLKDTANHYMKKPIGCVGLAANQIGYLHRIILIKFDSEQKIMINPILYIENEDKSVHEFERCLSRPNIRVKVKRFKFIRVDYTDEHGDKYFRVKFRDFDARVIQHEVDHLNGRYI